MRSQPKLWQVWWLGGAVAATLTALLVWATDSAYSAGYIALGALANAARVVVYIVWALGVWRCSRNVQRRFWTYVARFLVTAGLIASAVLY